jgi:hypothetical protein
MVYPTPRQQVGFATRLREYSVTHWAVAPCRTADPARIVAMGVDKTGSCPAHSSKVTTSRLLCAAAQFA